MIPATFGTDVHFALLVFEVLPRREKQEIKEFSKNKLKKRKKKVGFVV